MPSRGYVDGKPHYRCCKVMPAEMGSRTCRQVCRTSQATLPWGKLNRRSHLRELEMRSSAIGGLLDRRPLGVGGRLGGREARARAKHEKRNTYSVDIGGRWTDDSFPFAAQGKVSGWLVCFRPRRCRWLARIRPLPAVTGNDLRRRLRSALDTWADGGCLNAKACAR
jgi:hypothetical protein